jgi:hypothetical protein
MITKSHAKIRSTLTNLVVATTAFLFALLLVELGLRIFVGTAIQYQYDEEVLYRPLPNQKGFPSKYYLQHATVNSFGMRGSEVNPAANLRLLLVGDSHAFGVGLNDDETLSAQLERQFQQKYGPNVVVANGGIPGYGLHQITGLLKSQLNDFRPQGVILLYALGLVHRQRPTVETSTAYQRRMFLQRFAAYHVFKVLYIESLHRLNVQAYRLPTERYAAQLPIETRLETLWEIEQDNFEAIHNLTRQAQVAFVVVGHSPLKEDKRGYIKKQLSRFCSQHDIPLLEYFQTVTDPAYYVPRDGHYSALFYKELVAQFFNQRFDQRLLERSRSKAESRAAKEFEGP